MTDFCVFEPGHFDAQFSTPPPPLLNAEFVYIGYLASGPSIAYYHDTTCRVLDIGNSTGDAPYLRFQNNKLDQFRLVADAFENRRCSRGRVAYRIATEFLMPLGGKYGYTFEQLENALQFMFGFSAGALPFANLVQNDGARWAPFSDLWKIADASKLGAVVWDTVFPGANGPFLKRLLDLLEEVYKQGSPAAMGGPVPDIAHLSLSGGKHTHRSCSAGTVFERVCYTKAHIPTAAAQAGHSQKPAGTAAARAVLQPLVSWIDSAL